jgi:hypothetical protein
LPVYFGEKVFLDLDYVKHRLKTTGERLERNKRLAEALKYGIGVVSELAEPAFFYQRRKIVSVSTRSITLEGPVSFNCELLAEKFSNAGSVFAGIMTIGDKLEKRGRELKSEKGLIYSFAFDALALIAMDMAAKDFFTSMEQGLGSENLFLGAPMSPGESRGWAIEDQGTIFSMLEREVENVTINEASVLIPKNSASFIIGVYDHPTRAENDTNCIYCSMREKCMYSKV